MRQRLPQMRLLPVTIFVAFLMLSVRVSDIVRGVGWGGGQAPLAIAALQAQQPTPAGGPAPAEPKPGAKAEAKPAETALPGPVAGAPVNPGPPPVAEAGEAAGFTPNEIQVLNKLSERRGNLDQRGRELDMRESLLSAAEARIDKKIVELKTLQSSIEALLRKYDDQEDGKMRSLVKIYENMKPKDAARILEKLDMPVLLEVIERMNERKIAPILAEMDSAKAKSVTAEMAQRRQIPKRASDGAG